MSTTPRNPDWERELRALKRGWNSYNAAPITEQAIEIMKNILVGEPHIVPRVGGGLDIEWDEVLIQIAADGSVEGEI